MEEPKCDIENLEVGYLPLALAMYACAVLVGLLAAHWEALCDSMVLNPLIHQNNRLLLVEGCGALDASRVVGKGSHLRHVEASPLQVRTPKSRKFICQPLCHSWVER